MTTLKQRIEAIKATQYSDQWKKAQIKGARLTYARIAERMPSEYYPTGGDRGYWPSHPVGEVGKRDLYDEALAKD